MIKMFRWFQIGVCRLANSNLYSYKLQFGQRETDVNSHLLAKFSIVRRVSLCDFRPFHRCFPSAMHFAILLQYEKVVNSAAECLYLLSIKIIML